MTRYLTTLILIPLTALSLLQLINFSPSPIDPVSIENSPPMERSGALAVNDALTRISKLAEGQLSGPEDFIFASDGTILSANSDGWIKKIWLDGKVENISFVGGHPLGLKWGGQNNVVICEPYKGLLQLDLATKVVTVLTNESDGRPFKFVDNVDVACDGMMYFSDASDKFGMEGVFLDALESRPHGRLLSFDPRTRQTKTLLDNLAFANGVALSQDEGFVLVCESWRSRITRYWLKGSKAGTSDVFLDGLPGTPDNINRNEDGTFWIAFFQHRTTVNDYIFKQPRLKSIIARIPLPVMTKIMERDAGGWAIKVDAEGNALRSVEDAQGRTIKMVTSAKESKGKLYLGGLHLNFIGVLDLSVI